MLFATPPLLNQFLTRFATTAAAHVRAQVTANTVVYNDELDRWLGFSDPHEQPAVLQLGGNDPAALARAVAKSRAYPYSAINLNCGCPSDRVAGGGEHTPEVGYSQSQQLSKLVGSRRLCWIKKRYS